jgi:VIT1/CCC1 family predicted Fe2+/Mn2+ transporter
MFESLLAATIVSAIRGLLLLSALSWYIAKKQKQNPWHGIVEHVGIAIIVIIVTYFVGIFISNTFGG